MNTIRGIYTDIKGPVDYLFGPDRTKGHKTKDSP